MNKINIALGGVVVAIILAIMGLKSPEPTVVYQDSTPAVGAVTGVTNYNDLGVSQVKVGSGCNDEFTYDSCTATAINKVLEGTCNAIQKTIGSHAATSSAQYYCAVTGAAAGDRVFVTMPVGAGANADGAGSVYGGFVLGNANATSTGWIQFDIVNLTGMASSSFPQASTSIAYRVTN